MHGWGSTLDGLSLQFSQDMFWIDSFHAVNWNDSPNTFQLLWFSVRIKTVKARNWQLNPIHSFIPFCYFSTRVK